VCASVCLFVRLSVRLSLRVCVWECVRLSWAVSGRWSQSAGLLLTGWLTARFFPNGRSLCAVFAGRSSQLAASSSQLAERQTPNFHCRTQSLARPVLRADYRRPQRPSSASACRPSGNHEAQCAAPICSLAARTWKTHARPLIPLQ